MTEIVRYLETGAYGEQTGRQLIAKADAELPAPAVGTTRKVDPSFNLATVLLDAPTFKSVVQSVLKNGHEIVEG